MKNKLYLHSCFVNQLDSDDLKHYCVFGSHANGDKNFDGRKTAVESLLRKNNIQLTYDRQFLLCGDSFQSVIEDRIKCYAGLVFMSKELLASDWCCYEIGIFRMRNMPVFVYDPDNLLRDEQYKSCAFPLTRGAFVTSDVNRLVEEISKYHAYSVLYEKGSEEEEEISNSMYRSADSVMMKITLSSFVFSQDRQAFDNCGLGILHIQNGKDNNCRTAEDDARCENCTRCEKKEVDGRTVYRRCRLTNHTFFNGVIVDDVSFGTAIIFFLPVSKTCGTTFKIYFDAPNDEQALRLVRLFTDAGLSPSFSDSVFSSRIFISIPDNEKTGVRRLGKPFFNNYIPPVSAASGV